MITAQNLSFTYPGTGSETLHGLNFEIGAGEIFGFLGPSGPANRPPKTSSSAC